MKIRPFIHDAFDFKAPSFSYEFDKTFHRAHERILFTPSTSEKRLICFLSVPAHFVSIFARPLIYMAYLIKNFIQGIFFGIASVLHLTDENRAPKYFFEAAHLTTSILSAPFRQIIQTIRAFGGIFSPDLYFKTGSTPTRINHNLPEGIEFDGNIECSKNLPVDEPEEAIKLLAEQRNNEWPVYIEYTGEEGADGGGLRRDYVTRGFWAAAVKYELSKKVIDWSEDNDAFLVNLGQAIGYLTSAMPDCATGPVFHRDYFNILQFSYAELHAPEGFASLTLERQFQIYYKMCNQEQRNNLKDVKTILNWKGPLDEKRAEIEEIRGLYLLDIDTDNLENADPDAIKNDILDMIVTNKQKSMRTLYTIASNMDYTEESWNTLQLEGAAALEERIHGSFSRAVFFDRLEFVEGFSKEQKKTIKNWLKAQDDETLQNFLRGVTGASMIPPGGFQFRTTYSDKMTAHACFNYLDIPVVLTKEDIEFRLHEYSVSLEHVNGILGDAAEFTSR